MLTTRLSSAAVGVVDVGTYLAQARMRGACRAAGRLNIPDQRRKKPAGFLVSRCLIPAVGRPDAALQVPDIPRTDGGDR